MVKSTFIKMPTLVVDNWGWIALVIGVVLFMSVLVKIDTQKEERLNDWLAENCEIESVSTIPGGKIPTFNFDCDQAAAQQFYQELK